MSRKHESRLETRSSDLLYHQLLSVNRSGCSYDLRRLSQKRTLRVWPNLCCRLYLPFDKSYSSHFHVTSGLASLWLNRTLFIGSWEGYKLHKTIKFLKSSHEFPKGLFHTVVSHSLSVKFSLSNTQTYTMVFSVREHLRKASELHFPTSFVFFGLPNLSPMLHALAAASGERRERTGHA